MHTYPEIFESTTFSFRIQKFYRSHVADSNKIRLARDSGGKCALLLLLCRQIGLLFGKTLDTNLLRRRIKKYPDSPVHTLSDSLRIYFFHSGERIKLDSLLNSPDVCGRKPYPERKSCGYKNIRIRVDGT